MNLIAPTAVIYPNVILGDDIRIDDYCVIGESSSEGASRKPLEIGSGSHIRSHSVVYAGATLKDHVSTGHHAVIRSNSILEKGTSLGSYSSVDEDVSIGEYTRIHGYSQIGKGSIIGRFCWIYSLVTLTNDPLPPSFIFRPVLIGDMVTVSVGAQILPDIQIGSGSFISASSLVTEDVPEGMVVDGRPAFVVGRVKHMVHFETGTAHPWSKHFLSFYPKTVHEDINRMSKAIYGL